MDAGRRHDAEPPGGYFEKGKQYTGAPYSSVRSVGRYIGFDISVRTFLAAVENPHSVLYTEDLRGKVPNAAPYYGTVCSAFTSYALQCGIWEVSRRHGPEVSQGIVQVPSQSASTVEVGDVIYTPHTTDTGGSHVEIVTAVTRDANGQTTSVRVEESTSPTVKTTVYSVAKFDDHLASRNKRLFRIKIWTPGEQITERIRCGSRTIRRILPRLALTAHCCSISGTGSRTRKDSPSSSTSWIATGAASSRWSSSIAAR